MASQTQGALTGPKLQLVQTVPPDRTTELGCSTPGVPFGLIRTPPCVLITITFPVPSLLKHNIGDEDG